ncbi:MAG: M4 family metallopeptidase [Gammaproteobacteria bacterium]|nr:M4 family metallopeptidase [Gammaproteobacteria bacterium]MCW5583682.1 M4 family metallopeptidase [Gammaproteobacteria bacterium]
MSLNQKKFILSGALLFVGLSSSYGSAVYAAKSINLRHQNISVLQSLISTPEAAKGTLAIKEISRHVDFKNTLHVRVQQTYSGYNIWGANAIVHVPNGANVPKSLMSVTAVAKKNSTMNGTIYQDIHADLAGAPPIVFTEAQAQKALQQGVDTYQHKIGNRSAVSEQQSTLMVFVGKDKKAHWAYKVSFRSEPVKVNEKPSKQVYIIDATTFAVYANWDDIKTLENVDADGGGFGGNKKMGKMVYDGLAGNLAKLVITRDAQSAKCFLQNSDVTVKDNNTHQVMSFACKAVDEQHNNVYWDGDFDAVNDGYSPGNDALFGGQVIKHMYQDWYGVPVLKNSDGTPMMLNMVVHMRYYDNAYWDGTQMVFGDGASMFYPLTSLGVAAHEISHGFTEQHSNLMYYGQSGGMNEAFSDMATQAAEVYAYGPGKNSWQVAPEIFKAKDRALRYMDRPSKDCEGITSRECSIDDASQYTDWLDVHYSSGVYNHFFYFLGTTEGWDAKKAFDVMVHANSSYWTPDTTFNEGACGVISAASDLGYDITAVKAAFDQVKIDYSDC